MATTISTRKSRSMDERLKALKSLQQLVCIAAAAVFAFAVTSDQTKEYRAGLEELDYYRKVKYDDYPVYVENQFKKERDDDRALLLRAAKRAGLKYEKSVGLNEPVIMEYPSLTLQRLRDFENFVTTQHTVGVYMVEDEKQVATELSAQFRDKVEQQAKQQPSNSQPAANAPLPWSVAMMYANVGSGMSVRNVGVADPVVLHNSPNMESLNFSLFNGLPMPPVLTVSAACRFVPMKSPHPAFDWLMNDENGKHLIDPTTKAVFPKLRPYWERIAEMGADNAALFLQERIEASTKGSLNLFGVSVDRDLILLAGPAALAGLMLFFLLHLNQLNATSKWGDSEVESTSDYPWVMCFRGRFSSATTYGCLIVLPVASCVLLLLNHGAREEETTWGGVGLTSLVVIIGGFISLGIYRFRRRLGVRKIDEAVKQATARATTP